MSSIYSRVYSFAWIHAGNQNFWIRLISLKNRKRETSSQDGGVGRYTLPPHTTKRRTTINLKAKINQNFQKIELYRILTTKELKKKHSSRPVGGKGMGGRDGEDAQQGGSWRAGAGKLAAGREGGPTFVYG